jgi:hypothetical protein
MYESRCYKQAKRSEQEKSEKHVHVNFGKTNEGIFKHNPYHKGDDMNSHNSEMRSAVFWDFTQRRIVISQRRFGTDYRSRNVGTKLSFYAACNLRREHISLTLQRRSEISYESSKLAKCSIQNEKNVLNAFE